MKKTRFFAGLLVALMLLSLLPISALAEGSSEQPEVVEETVVVEAPGNVEGAEVEDDQIITDVLPTEGETELLNSAVETAIAERAEGAYIKNSETTYANVLGAIADATDGDVIELVGRVLWGGDTETDTVLDGSVTITSAAEGGALVANGANGRDPAPNVTHLVSGVTFKDITIEQSAGVNYLYANGHRFELSNVEFIFNGSEISGELSSRTWLLFGGSDLRDVESAEMVIGENDGRIVSVVGGGFGHNVTGDVNMTVNNVSDDCIVFGGGLQGNVDGKVTLETNCAVFGLRGGSYQGHAGSVDLAVNGNVSTYGVYGGCQLGHVDGDVTVTIGENAVIGSTVHGGCNTDKTNYWSANWRGGLQLGSSNITDTDTYVGGNTDVTVDGTVGSVVSGGGSSAMVKGNTHVVVNGTVGTDPDWYTGVYGSGSGKTGGVGGNTYVEIAESGKVLRAVTDLGTCGGVVGGGYAGTISGDTMVVINGTVGDDILGGTVFGGGARGGDVLGTTNVVMNKAVYDAKEQKDDWFGFGAYGLGIGRVCGVFGGGFNGITSGSTNVEINVDMGAAPIYGGGVISIVEGSTAVTLNNGARADKVVGGSQTVCPMGYQEEGTGLVAGTATVTLKGDAAVSTINGYEQLNDTKTVADSTTVTFDGNIGAVKQIINADAVKVTNASAVTIDNGGVDNDQLVNVTDLSVTGKSKLTLPASAHILGNYSGDTAEQKGTLVLSAGKGVTADGTVTGQTDISIVDTAETKPAEAQVYVISKLGSTIESGDFTWVDRRTGLAMAWKGNDDQTSQWWLVKYDEPTPPPVDPVDPPGVTTYKITVKYVDLAGETLANEYTIRKNAGSRYDVTEQAAKSIEGYAIDRTKARLRAPSAAM